MKGELAFCSKGVEKQTCPGVVPTPVFARPTHHLYRMQRRRRHLHASASPEEAWLVACIETVTAGSHHPRDTHGVLQGRAPVHLLERGNAKRQTQLDTNHHVDDVRTKQSPYLLRKLPVLVRPAEPWFPQVGRDAPPRRNTVNSRSDQAPPKLCHPRRDTRVSSPLLA